VKSQPMRPDRRHSEIGTYEPLGERATRTMTVALAAAGAVFIAATAAPPAHATSARTDHETATLVEITNLYSPNLRLDVMWGSIEAGAGVFLWPDNAGTSQEFEKIDSGDGFFRLKAQHSGQCLRTDWREGTVTNGTPIIQWWSCSQGYSPAEWSLSYVRDTLSHPGSFGPTKMLIRDRDSGLCLDARNDAAGPPPWRVVVQVRNCVTADTDPNVMNQLWSFTPATSQPVKGPHSVTF
jgi:hypothetical protein